MVEQTIYKYTLPIGDTVEVEMPRGARILHVGTQDQDHPAEPICMWALVYPNNPKRKRVFHIRGTGHDCAGLSSQTLITRMALARIMSR